MLFCRCRSVFVRDSRVYGNLESILFCFKVFFINHEKYTKSNNCLLYRIDVSLPCQAYDTCTKKVKTTRLVDYLVCGKTILILHCAANTIIINGKYFFLCDIDGLID